MKKEIADHWVLELRSGKFKQGKGTLRSSTKHYCCLGVLSEMSGFSYSGSYLRQDVQDWAGMSNHAGRYAHDSLSEQNDAGSTFKEIADVIEKHWEEL